MSSLSFYILWQSARERERERERERDSSTVKNVPHCNPSGIALLRGNSSKGSMAITHAMRPLVGPLLLFFSFSRLEPWDDWYWWLCQYLSAVWNTLFVCIHRIYRHRVGKRAARSRVTLCTLSHSVCFCLVLASRVLMFEQFVSVWCYAGLACALLWILIIVLDV